MRETRREGGDEQPASEGERDRSSSATAIDEAWQETLANATLRVSMG